MDRADLDLRNLTYGLFVELGRAPTAEEMARASGSTTWEVETGWRRLHEQHAFVLDADTNTLLMANPFSAVPTPYRVQAQDRWWYGNCAWDAFGICAALQADGRIESSCPDCGEPVDIDRLSADWRPHTRQQNQAILDRLGLTDPVWQLPS